MKFLTIVKKLSDTINCYDKNYKPFYPTKNATNPFLKKKDSITMVWIDSNNSIYKQ